MEKVKRLLIISSDENLKKVLHFCFDGWGYEVFIHDSPVSDINYVKKISPDAIVVDVYSASKYHLSICRLLKEDLITAFIPVITLINKRQLREELLHLKQGVDDYLIKPPDPLDLRVRIEMAVKRSQYSFYTSPLTGLPGGRIIEEALNEKIKNNACFCFGYIDIDNFKYFNDVYGYVNGDKIIMQTAYILYTTIRKFGNKGDFIGHIGGDDFVFISSIEKSLEVSRNFICMFDNTVPFHYSAEDRCRGFIMARDRNRKVKKAPLASVSVALINRGNPEEYRTSLEINEKITEIKKYLKEIPGSKFMADRRTQSPSLSEDAVVYQKNENLLDSYRPLGQILLEKNIITQQRLDEALRIHWRKDIILGETLKELKFITEEQLQDALKLQRERLSHLIAHKKTGRVEQVQ